MNMEVRDFAVLIKDIRRQLAFSQEDLARQIGVSYATVSWWEKYQSRPLKLARVQL